jgi:LPXTG-motif cell wall-anchored protein
MRRIIVLVSLAVLVMGMASCPGYVDGIYQDKCAAWRAEHPGEVMPEEVAKQLWDESVAQAKKDTQTAIGAGGQIATGFGTGNYLLVVTGILGLFGIGTGLYARHRRKR